MKRCGACGCLNIREATICASCYKALDCETGGSEGGTPTHSRPWQAATGRGKLALLVALLALSGCASATGRPMVQYDALARAYDAGLLKGVLDTRCVKGEKPAPVRVIGQDGKEVFAELPAPGPEIDAKTCALLRAMHRRDKAILDAYLIPPSQLDLEQLMRLGMGAAL